MNDQRISLPILKKFSFDGRAENFFFPRVPFGIELTEKFQRRVNSAYNGNRVAKINIATPYGC